MEEFKLAMTATTAHGLPRMVTNKPIYVRVAWLLFFLFMLVLFIKGFAEFVVKLQSRQVTTSMEVNSVKFQFPDLYMCFENPISGSYSANIDAKTARAINASLNATSEQLRQSIRRIEINISDETVTVRERMMSFLYTCSLPYSLLINGLAHRLEQSVISADALFVDQNGMPNLSSFEAVAFYHPIYLRCMQWKISPELQEKLFSITSWSGLSITVLLDTSHSGLNTSGIQVDQRVFSRSANIPLSDWSLKTFWDADRAAGVRVFVTPPGEYPSDFVTSFILSPGKHQTVEIAMTQQVYKDGQFGCVNEAPEVQFENPLNQTPYTHNYSYSYCYYYEYHKQFQSLFNLSGGISPLPWPLRGKKYVYNISELPHFGSIDDREPVMSLLGLTNQNIQKACENKRPCSTLDYSVSISSADWPTQSSLAPFVSSSIMQAWISAKARNLSVPVLDFLLTSNASSVASYVRSNMLKVHFKPHRVTCDKITFSIDYGLPNFISDIGGIMGIYLGMSLLTMCELLELLVDIALLLHNRLKVSSTDVSAIVSANVRATGEDSCLEPI